MASRVTNKSIQAAKDRRAALNEEIRIQEAKLKTREAKEYKSRCFLLGTELMSGLILKEEEGSAKLEFAKDCPKELLEALSLILKRLDEKLTSPRQRDLFAFKKLATPKDVQDIMVKGKSGKVTNEPAQVELSKIDESEGESHE